ncbi:MAG: hypothetical protein AAF215_18435 [Cyanobacteria bacterium P01_A01_bin.123]
MGIKISNDLGLKPTPKRLAKQQAAQVPVQTPIQTPVQTPIQPVPNPPEPVTASAGALQLDFAFELPKGYLDNAGYLHRRGVMRLARAMDEVTPMRDPRVLANPAYATIIILSRVITQLGTLPEVTPVIVEQFFACDLNYLQNFYRRINELEEA